MYNNQYLKSQLSNEEVLVVNSEIDRQKNQPQLHSYYAYF